MNEPTVQVPVSLLYDIANTVGEESRTLMVDALLSQPTPTAERWQDRPHEVREDVDDYSMCLCGSPVAAALHDAEPPRIEDMAPVATHSSGEHRRVRLGEGDDLPVCDTCTNVLGLNVRWDHAILRPDHDPSTIRDVTPPEDAA